MRRPWLALIVASGLVLAPLTPVAGAQPRTQQRDRQRDVAARIQSLREQVSEASAAEAALLDRLDEVRHRRQELDARVRGLDRQLAVARRDADAAEARLEIMQGDFVRTQTGLAQATDRLAVERAALRARAVQAYMGRPSTTPAEVLMRAGSVRDVAAVIGYQGAVVRLQRRAVRAFTAHRDATARLRVVLEAKKDDARAQRDVVVERRAAIEAVRDEQDAVRQAVLAEEVQQRSLVAEAHTRVAEFEAEIAALRAESGSITAFLRGVQAGQPAPSGGAGQLGAPAPPARFTSAFGPRVHPVLGTVRMHDGADFGAPTGTPIRSAAAGTVVLAGPRGGYGNTTIVDHGNSLATLYAHQHTIAVQPGQTVAAGQVIGTVGSTGMSTGPHLHFEVRVAGVPVNPLPYF